MRGLLLTRPRTSTPVPLAGCVRSRRHAQSRIRSAMRAAMPARRRSRSRRLDPSDSWTLILSRFGERCWWHGRPASDPRRVAAGYAVNSKALVLPEVSLVTSNRAFSVGTGRRHEVQPFGKLALLRRSRNAARGLPRNAAKLGAFRLAHVECHHPVGTLETDEEVGTAVDAAEGQVFWLGAFVVAAPIVEVVGIRRGQQFLDRTCRCRRPASPLVSQIAKERPPNV